MEKHDQQANAPIYSQAPFYIRLAHRLRIIFPLLLLLLFLIAEAVEEMSGLHTHFGPSGPHEGFLLEIFVFGVLGPTIAGLGFHWIVKIVDQLEVARASERKLRLELEEQTESRRELLAATVRNQETERRRVARELHDGIGQPLTAFLLTSESSEPEICDSPTLQHARRAASSTLEGMRRLILDLRPSLLDAQGLLPALRQCAQNVLGSAQINVTVTAVGQPQPLPDEAEIALFRIGQETCTNILRHAQAQNANLQLKYTPEQIQFIAQDDGIGFDPAAGNGRSSSLGLGLLSMQERAEQVGGDFALHSQPGQGTTITISIPLTDSKGDPT
jgi:signal transduction histidine kinase